MEERWKEWTITHKTYQELGMRERHVEAGEVAEEGERERDSTRYYDTGGKGYGGGYEVGTDIMLRHFLWSGGRGGERVKG